MSTKLTSSEVVEAAIDVVLGLSKVVYHLAGPSAAAAVACVTPEVYEQWTDESDIKPLREAAKGAQLVAHAEQLAVYAWEGTWAGSEGDLDDALTEAFVVEPLLPTNLVDADYVTVVPAASADIIQSVLMAANARRALDHGLGNLTVFTLAALAGVAEKTIRMAANPKNELPLRTSKQGTSTLIRPFDALDWLERRPDFRPTKYFASASQRPQVGTPKALASFLAGARGDLKVDVESLAAALDWSHTQADAYGRIESEEFSGDSPELQPRDLFKLAHHLGVHEPEAFAAQAYRALATAHTDALIAQQLSEMAQ